MMWNHANTYSLWSQPLSNDHITTVAMATEACPNSQNNLFDYSQLTWLITDWQAVLTKPHLLFVIGFETWSVQCIPTYRYIGLLSGLVCFIGTFWLRYISAWMCCRNHFYKWKYICIANPQEKHVSNYTLTSPSCPPHQNGHLFMSPGWQPL